MKKTPLYLAIAGLTLAAGNSAVYAQEEVLEEIVVTGSLIPSSTQEGRSTPVDVVSSVDIEAAGSPNVADILRNQTFQYGVESVSNIIASNGSAGTSAVSNIRGLGNTSTLTLMNGRRVPTIAGGGVNVRTMYPQIMLERLETVTDGASALYGTDAVAGINNYIPRNSFEGLEVEGYYGAASGDGDYNQRNFSILTGGTGDDSNYVFAVSYRKRSELRFTDRPYYSQGSFSSAGEGNPGNFLVPSRYTNDLTDSIYDPTSADYIATAVPNELTGARSATPDPGCALNNQGSGDKREIGSFSTGQLVFGACRGEFGANFVYAAPEDVLNVAYLFNHDFSDTLSFESEFVYNRQRSTNTGSPSNPGGRSFLLPNVLGTHPGNPFRAANDVDLDGSIDPATELLYAQDSNTDGVPDRDASGNVILAASPFDPTSGIAFNEDVGVGNWRPTYFPTKNGVVGPSNLNNNGTANGAGTFITEGHRIVGQLNYDFDNSWSGYSSYVYHRTVVDTPINVQSLSALSSGLTGTLRTSAGNEYYNPFSTQFFDCVTNPVTGQFRDCDGQGAQTDPAQLNSQEAFDQVSFYESTYTETTLQTFESIFTGEVADTGAGTIQAAAGLQWRRTELDVDAGGNQNSGDAYIQALVPDYRADRDVYSLFGELRAPLFDSNTLGYGELSLAARSERTDDNSTADLDSDTYKLAGLWQINDMVSLRASFGTAFISPGLRQLFAPRTTGLSNVTDSIASDSGFKSRLLGGNPALEAEEADVSNIGFTLNFLEGDLTFDLDLKVFDFEDRIIRPLPQDLLTKDAAAYAAAGNTNGNLAQVIAWAAGPDSDPRIQRNPLTGFLVQVNAENVNATAQKWKGFDTRLAYGFDSNQIPFVDSDFGRFSAVLSGTYIDEYSYQSDPDDPLVNGAGRRNDETGFVPALPRVRATLNLGWSHDVHSVSLIGRYTHSYLQDDTLCGLNPFFLAAVGATNSCTVGEEIPSYTIWDAQYRADLDGLFGDTTTVITLGAINAFDRDGYRDVSLGGTEVGIVDPVGQQIYLRVRQSF